jgi:hypothetical protein
VMFNQRGLWTWWTDNPKLATVVTGTVATLAGLLGISRASMVRAARSSLQTWSKLLWNRALARVICRSTLRVQLLFPDRPSRWTRARGALRHPGGALGRAARAAARERDRRPAATV